MKNNIRFHVIFVLIFGFVSFNANAISQYTYTPIIGMGQPYDINESGQVVGGSSGSNFKPAYWENGTTIVIANPPEAIYSSSAYSINENGQVAGYISTATGSKYFIWDKNSPIEYLDSLSDLGSTGESIINDSGRVALMSYNASNQLLPYIFYNGSIIPAHTLEGIFSISDMNNSGVIVGTSSAGAYSLAGGVITSLGALTSIGTSNAFAISQNGYIVGASNVSNGHLQAVLWDSQGIFSIGGDHTIARGVNDSKQIVGELCGLTSGAGCEAFLWENGQLYNLNDLLVTSGAPTLINALDINNSGQIIGTDITRQAYLLTPIPIPAAFWLFGSGLVGLIGSAWRKKARNN